MLMLSGTHHARAACAAWLLVVALTHQVSAQQPQQPVAGTPPSAAVAPAPVVQENHVPPTPSTPEPTSSYETSPEPESPPEHGPCLLGSFCFGPVVTLGVLDVFGIGLHARSDYFGASVDYQFFNFTARGVPISLSLFTVEGRVYPFAGAFFLGAGLAWQHGTGTGHVTYSGDSQVPPIDSELRGRVSVPVLKLGIGFQGRSGFIMGIDLGFGVQLGSNTVSFSSDLPRVAEVIDAENKIRDRADTWIRGLPFLLQLNLLRIGYLF